MSKTATIFAPAPTKECRFALVPYGLFANKQLVQCEIGGTVIFADTWKRVKFRLVRCCKLSVKSSVFVFMLRSIYGETMTYDRFMERWQGVAVSEGWGKSAFDEDSVLLIELQNL